MVRVTEVVNQEKQRGIGKSIKMKKKFSWKAFISIGLFYSFFIIFITGLALYISPPGRIAHWQEWKFMGITKENWEAIHVIFSFSFVILSIFHLFTVNWKAFWSYITKKKKKGLNKKREFYISTILIIGFFVGTYFSIPPFSSIMNLSETIKESWEDVNQQPPVSHAELLNLIELSKVVESLSLEQIIKQLENSEIKIDSVEQSLEEIAESNSTTPAALYGILKISGTTGGKGQGGGQGSGQGGGMGRKTVETIAFENGLDVDIMMDILWENNIEAKKNQSLREIAEINGISTMEIYNLLLAE